MDKYITFIRDTIEREHLTYTWLSIQVMRTSGIKTCSSELSAVLSGERTGPKAKKMILAAVRVCNDYLEVFS